MKNGLDTWSTAKIFIAGEIHGVKENSQVKFDLIEYLVNNNGVRKIVLELVFFDSMALNKYLQTGNEKILHSMINNYPCTYAFSKNEIIFWQRLYKYNARLEKSKKLTVVGVDCNGKVDSIYKYILFLLRKQELFSKKDSRTLLNTIQVFKKNIKENAAEGAEKTEEKVYQLLNGYSERKSEAYVFFKNLVDELFAHGNMLLYPDKRKEIRENYICQKILEEYSKIPSEGKIFGQFGVLHVSSDITNKNAAVEKIIEKIHQKCVRILYSYRKCIYYVVEDGKVQFRDLEQSIIANGNMVFEMPISVQYTAFGSNESDCFYIRVNGT